MRGEHWVRLHVKTFDTGSSPRARGAQSRRRPGVVVRGLIPACAGSTSSRRRLRSRCGAHPRVRGEHCRLKTSSLVEAGSSPRARGARAGHARQRRGPGLIPACAGSTEHGGVAVLADDGSSPRARGAQRADDDARHALGLIPACAGSTYRSRCGPVSTRAHPRVRGEHDTAREDYDTETGSSPRARGAPGAADAGAQADGLIPACAGSTDSMAAASSGRWAHPRVRGEHTS